MINNDPSNSTPARTMDRDSAPAVLPLGPEMKEAFLEWYEYHIRLCDTQKVSIVVTLADIMGDNQHAEAYREAGARAFGLVSIPFIPNPVQWVRIGNEPKIRMISEDIGPADWRVPLCLAMLAEFFRDIRETEPELSSIFAGPLPEWIEIYWKGRAECTGRLPVGAGDSIH